MSPRAPWFRALTVLLTAMILFSGCMTVRTVEVKPGVVAVVKADEKGELKVHHLDGGAYAAVVVCCCVIFLFVVIVDCIILPWTWGYYHHPFCCTQEVIVVIRD